MTIFIIHFFNFRFIVRLYLSVAFTFMLCCFFSLISNLIILFGFIFDTTAFCLYVRNNCILSVLIG